MVIKLSKKQAVHNRELPFRIAVLWSAQFSDSCGGVELMKEHLKSAFPHAEFVTPSSCASNLLCRLKFPWFGLGWLLKAVAVGHHFFKLHKQKPFDIVMTLNPFGIYLTFRRPAIPIINIYCGAMKGVLRSAAMQGWRNRIIYHLMFLFEVIGGWRKDRCVTLSNSSWADIKRYNKIDCDIILQGVDLNMFYPGDKLKAREGLILSKENLLALFVGRSEYAKGYDIILELAKIFPQIKFVLVLPRPVATAQSNVVVLTRLSDPEMASCYRAADFLVHPSRFESCPSYTVLQAMATNLPVIVSKRLLFDLPAGIDAKELGILVEDEKVELYAEAIRENLNKPKAVNSRSIVEKYYSLDQYISHYQALVKNMLKSQQGNILI